MLRLSYCPCPQERCFQAPVRRAAHHLPILWFGGGIDAFMSAKDDGLLEQVPLIDASGDLAEDFKDPEGYWYSKGITIVGLLCSTTAHGGAYIEALPAGMIC